MQHEFKSGYVNIFGKANAGKSTLLNALIGERLAAITPKVQTTRKRILGILNDPQYQIIFSDTPGIIETPEYKLQEWMNEQIQTALQDADIVIYLTSPGEKVSENIVLKRMQHIKIPALVVINKSDLADENLLKFEVEKWQHAFPHHSIFTISALHKKGIEILKTSILNLLPVHPPYFDEDVFTDQSERAIVSDIIREKLLLQYQKEIPYSVEVQIESFKEKETITVIRAILFVEKESHKNIILGKNGFAIKKLGTDSRISIEAWLLQKVFLELFIKVKENWKNDDRSLQEFGYY